jgi:O-methyltransferase involved in polyketide biosynthesis
MYLDEEVVRHQLGELRRIAAIASRLAVDFYPPSNAGTSRNKRQRRLQRAARVGSGESFKLVVDRVQAVGLVQECGWEVTDETSLREAARSLVGRDAGLPVNAINANKTLVAAMRP